GLLAIFEALHILGDIATPVARVAHLGGANESPADIGVQRRRADAQAIGCLARCEIFRLHRPHPQPPPHPRWRGGVEKLSDLPFILIALSILTTLMIVPL